MQCDSQVGILRGPQSMRRIQTPEGEPFTAVSAARFAGPLREAIHAFKYTGTPQLSPALARLMVDAVRAAGVTPDAVVPVPLHAKRQRERGYNQSELLARQIAASLRLPHQPRLLARVRHTEQQATLKGPDARRANVSHAFQVLEAPPGHVLLVDDVLTTGATMMECASALMRAGARDVTALTLARAD